MGIKIENGDIVLQQHCADMVKKIPKVPTVINLEIYFQNL